MLNPRGTSRKNKRSSLNASACVPVSVSSGGTHENAEHRDFFSGNALSKIEAKADSSIWGAFDKADVNLDGYITKPEYQAYLEVSRAPASPESPTR
jgi:hypothetical protein